MTDERLSLTFDQLRMLLEDAKHNPIFELFILRSTKANEDEEKLKRLEWEIEVLKDKLSEVKKTLDEVGTLRACTR